MRNRALKKQKEAQAELVGRENLISNPGLY